MGRGKGQHFNNFVRSANELKRVLNEARERNLKRNQVAAARAARRFLDEDEPLNRDFYPVNNEAQPAPAVVAATPEVEHVAPNDWTDLLSENERDEAKRLQAIDAANRQRFFPGRCHGCYSLDPTMLSQIASPPPESSRSDSLARPK